jgi:transposase-like protein
MKGTRHSEEQIIAILKQGEAGLATAELCRQHGITEQTYYHWNAKYVRSAITCFSFPVKKLVAPAGLRAAVSCVEVEYDGDTEGLGSYGCGVRAVPWGSRRTDARCC